MRPAIFSTSEDAFTASGKSPMICVSAIRNRLPKLWPFSPRPALEAMLEQSRKQRFVFDSATMQLRISPGGSTSNSRRSRPELPPSSVTVTIAVMSRSGSRSGLRVAFQALQQRGKARAAADRDNAQRFLFSHVEKTGPLSRGVGQLSLSGYSSRLNVWCSAMAAKSESWRAANLLRGCKSIARFRFS